MPATGARDLSLALEATLSSRGVHSVFQPVVDLTTGETVGYEALARGSAPGLEAPDALFAAARSTGRVAELDQVCQEAAVDAALAAGMQAPLGLFVNVEPGALASGAFTHLQRTWDRTRGRCQLVVELTERALTTAPAELLAQVDRLRGLGYLIALDDVGADPRSLALMPFLRPEVIKLDLRLAQAQPSQKIAEIVHAVSAESERTGAVVVAEGVETEAHVETALAFGATLAQGWRFGRPGTLPPLVDGTGGWEPSRPVEAPSARTPVELVRANRPLRVVRKRLLVSISERLERQAALLGDHAVVLATFQTAEYFGGGVSRRYQRLGEQTAFVAIFAAGLEHHPAPGVVGQSLSLGEPLQEEWNVGVIAPHFAGMMVSLDLGDEGVPDLDRRFEFAVTYDRALAVQSARLMMDRIDPDLDPIQAPRAA